MIPHMWIGGTENIRLGQAALWTKGLHVFGRFILLGFPQACKRQRKENWVNELDRNFIYACRNSCFSDYYSYCWYELHKEQKGLKKDPSASLPASDGSDDNLAK